MKQLKGCLRERKKKMARGIVNGALKNMQKQATRKARNSARQAVYMAMWNEEPPKRKKLVQYEEGEDEGQKRVYRKN